MFSLHFWSSSKVNKFTRSGSLHSKSIKRLGITSHYHTILSLLRLHWVVVSQEYWFRYPFSQPVAWWYEDVMITSLGTSLWFFWGVSSSSDVIRVGIPLYIHWTRCSISHLTWSSSCENSIHMYIFFLDPILIQNWALYMNIL